MTPSVIVMAPDDLVRLVRSAVRDEVGAVIHHQAGREDAGMAEDEAARFLGVAANTLRQWRAEKRGPAYHRMGRSVRYTRDDLEHWKAGNRVLTIDSFPEGRHA